MKAITVAKLIEILRELPQEAQVQADGCDCIGPVQGATIIDKGQLSSWVLIERISPSEVEDNE